MKPSLVFVAPEWSTELDELLQVTKQSFQIKVLTQKQVILLEDPYIEILQCFDSYSPLEMAKLLPWMLQLNSPHFHVILPTHSHTRILSGVGALITMVKALPHCGLSHSPWMIKGWGFQVWQKAFQNLFDFQLENNGVRFLSIPKPSHSTNHNNYNLKELELYKQLWVLPTQNILDSQWRPLIQRLTIHNINCLEFWNWERQSLREQNKIREIYSSIWEQIQFHPARSCFEDWSEVKFLILIGKNQSLFSETDLIDLVLKYQIHIILDQETRQKLKAPWKDGDTFWLWHPLHSDNEHRPWNDPYQQLTFINLNLLREFKDQQSNHILRTLLNASSTINAE